MALCFAEGVADHGPIDPAPRVPSGSVGERNLWSGNAPPLHGVLLWTLLLGIVAALRRSVRHRDRVAWYWNAQHEPPLFLTTPASHPGWALSFHKFVLMDKNLTPERFNALPLHEQIAYLVKAGNIIATDEFMTTYQLFNFQVRMRMMYKPLRIVAIRAGNTVDEEGS